MDSALLGGRYCSISKMSSGGRDSNWNRGGAFSAGLPLLIHLICFRANARSELAMLALEEFADPDFWRP